jgi:uncharacterized protein
MSVVSEVPITMNDGVILYANVGYPTDPATGQRAPGRFPVLLTQNPYAGPSEQPDPFYVDRGYIFVSVDVRGTLDSQAPNGGPLVNELFGPRQTEDGVELVNWAAHQLDGSNGVIGLTGCSYLGINQLFTAAALGPHSPVKAILPACASNSYEIYFAGGIPGPTIGLFGEPSPLSGTKHEPENTAAGLALEKEILAGGPSAYNDQYWQERTTSPALAAQIVQNRIPALLWSGWGAPEASGALQLYAAFQNAWSGRPVYGPMSAHQPTTGRYQIVIGPWGHGQGLDESIQLEWYDTWLKGEHTDMTDTHTPLHLFDNGSSQWINGSTDPVASAFSEYYLSSGGALIPNSRGSRSQGTQSSSDAITWGQPSSHGTTLTYTSAPFTRGVTVAGPISATVYASSSNQNLELIATLNDLGPGGTLTPITTGALLGSMRAIDPQQSWFDRNGVLIMPSHPYLGNSYVSAGQTARYDITLNPTLWTLEPGHSLQLVLSTQEPTADCASLISALKPAIPCLLTAPQQATLPGGVYQVDHSRRLPSSVNVPLVSTDRLPVAASGITTTSNGLTEPLGWNSPLAN